MSKILHWTYHAKKKMRQYRLSRNRVLRVLFRPKRVEKGIAPKTIALMQSSSPKKEKGEVWLMYQDRKDKRIIISTWRYPGITKPGEEIPIPEDIRKFLKKYKNARIL